MDPFNVISVEDNEDDLCLIMRAFKKPAMNPTTPAFRAALILRLLCKMKNVRWSNRIIPCLDLVIRKPCRFQK